MQRHVAVCGSLIILTLGCRPESALHPSAIPYSLRALTTSGSPVSVPGAIPNGALQTDSAGYTDGQFQLGVGNTWQLTLSRYFVVDGERRPTVLLNDSGRYRVVRVQQNELVIDLSDGRPGIAINSPIVFLRGDSAFYGLLVFTR